MLEAESPLKLGTTPAKPAKGADSTELELETIAVALSLLWNGLCNAKTAAAVPDIIGALSLRWLA